MKFKRSSLPEAEVSLTPLIDVVFLLLIFFVLTTRLPEQQLELNLPSLTNSSNATNQAISEQRVINIFADKTISLDNSLLADLDQLKQQLQAVQEQIADVAIILRADAKVEHQQLVAVLEILQELQLHQVELSVLPAQ